MSTLSPAEKAELVALASAAQPGLDPKLVDHLAELAALGCQPKDVKDYLRCLVARSGGAGAGGSGAGGVRASK
jgi:hypothetical protein